MKRFARLVAWLVLVSSASHAAVVDGLHTAVVPVTDRSEQAFAAGLRAALAVVLVKLTGDSRAPTFPGAGKLLGTARQYLTGFGYEQAADSALTLRAAFDARALEDALLARGFALWGRERPALRVRLAVEPLPAGSPAYVPAPLDAYASAQRQAALRGVPLSHAPATDAIALPAVGAETAMQALLADAADTEAILVGRVTQTEVGTWTSRWLLRVGSEILEFTQGGAESAPLAARGVDFAADALGARYATAAATGGDQRLDLTVRDVRSAEDYGRVSSYMRGVDGVRRLGVKQVEGTNVVFDVTVRGGIASLAQSVGLGTLLAPEPAQPAVYHLAH